MSDVEQTHRRLRKELGHEPEIQEIARELYEQELEPESARLLREKVAQVMQGLTLTEKAILRSRFGLNDGRPRTLEEVGEEFKVDHQQIRDIEVKGLKKLRHPIRSRWPQP
jgi:RNA polymerase primary sigma factor